MHQAPALHREANQTLSDDRAQAIDVPPIETRFRLGATVTPQQRAFLDKYGFLIFEAVASPAEVAMILEEIEDIQRRWLAEGRTKVNGIPLWAGKDHNGEPFLQRLPFSSMFSDKLRSFVRDPRFEPIRTLIGANARVGDEEKDGLVVNRFLNVPGSAYPRLGWHTDGLRDLFYLRMPKEMLNVGLHLDRVSQADGGLRIIPGTHKQGFFKMCFHKPYFVSHKPDPREIAVETQPGDLTLHDGRTWHRVERSPHSGARSLRRVMYVPYLTDPYEPKSDRSKTPLYHYLPMASRWLKKKL